MNFLRCSKCGHDDFTYKISVEWHEDCEEEVYEFRCKKCGKEFSVRCRKDIDVMADFIKLKEEICADTGLKGDEYFKCELCGGILFSSEIVLTGWNVECLNCGWKGFLSKDEYFCEGIRFRKKR